jgi:hypothetical protein
VKMASLRSAASWSELATDAGASFGMKSDEMTHFARAMLVILPFAALELGGCGQSDSGAVPTASEPHETPAAGGGATNGGVPGIAGQSGGVPPGAGGSASGGGTGGSTDGGATAAGGLSGISGSGEGGGTATSCAKWYEGVGPASQWVYVDQRGELSYKSVDSRGDRILDFSQVGYRGGGVALPQVPVKKKLQPSGGDDTSAIQAAIDAVAQSTAVDGARGAIELSAGTFRLSGSLRIAASGVVLRGAGSGRDGTVLKVEGSPRTVLILSGSGQRTPSGKPTKITDAYVPVGSRALHVDDTTGLSVGDDVLVQRPVTAAWIHFMGMDTLVRNGAPQTWLKAGSSSVFERKITAIDGDEVTIEPGVADSIDAKYLDPPAASLTRFTYPGRISNVGVEGLRVTTPPASVPINQATFSLLSADDIIDSWIDDVHADGFINGLNVGNGAKWLTVRKVSIVHTAPIDGSAGYPADFLCSGQQILFVGCSSEGSQIFSFVTQALVAGPNVVFDFVAKGSPTSLQPHQRWATGLLLDNVKSSAGNVQLINRKTAGSGHGWTIGWGVVWNAEVNSLDIQQPPGSQNWAIGSSGSKASGATGAFDSPGVAVKPGSLYLAQLCQRLGPQAVATLGYR